MRLELKRMGRRRGCQEAGEMGRSQILEGLSVIMVRSLVFILDFWVHTCHHLKALLSIGCMCMTL